MSFLINKFKGIYRIMCPIDATTNDFPRKLNGTYEDIDLYIACKNNIQIFYQGRNVLQAYIPSVQRGNNIIKAINGIDPTSIFNIRRTDTEVTFEFKYADSDKIIPLLKPKTAGAGISPYSSKNRPVSEYTIPDKDLAAYTKIVANLPFDRVLNVHHITQSFLKTLVNKKFTAEQLKADMRLKGLKAKEYIHSIGKWDKYISYLNKNLMENN